MSYSHRSVADGESPDYSGTSERSFTALEANSFIAFFSKLPPSKSVRLFERAAGEYYSVHGENALFVAREFYKTNSVLKSIGSATDAVLPSCTLSRASFEAFLADALQVHRLNIEIWAPPPPSATSFNESRHSAVSRGATSTPAAWVLAKQASPGNLIQIEDLLCLDSCDPIIAAVHVSERPDDLAVGIAFANASDKTFGIHQFFDVRLLPNLEALLIQLNVRELLVLGGFANADASNTTSPTNSPRDIERLCRVLESSGVAITSYHPAPSDRREISLDDINHLLSAPLSVLPDLPAALPALAALVNYLGLRNDPTFEHQFVLREHRAANFARLDSYALNALCLVPLPGSARRSSTHLFGLLNRCRTAGGARLLNTWIRQPLRDVSRIRDRQLIVTMFINDLATHEQVLTQLLGTPDLARLAKKLRRGSASLEDIVVLYHQVLRMPSLLAAIEDNGVLRERYSLRTRALCEILDPFAALVIDTVDLEAINEREFRVRATFDPELTDIAARLDQLKAQFEPEMLVVASALDVEPHKVLKIDFSVVHGHHLRLSLSKASLIRGKGYIELATQKAGVLFTTVTLLGLSKNMQKLSSEYNSKQTTLVRELLNAAATYTVHFCDAADMLSELDVLRAFGQVCRDAPMPYTMPILYELGTATTGCNLELVACRHPCVEAQDDMCFIANDVRMGRNNNDCFDTTISSKKYDNSSAAATATCASTGSAFKQQQPQQSSSSSFLVITGPNMGGKSTYIRMVGVCAVMAQIGCGVPCTKARMPVFDAVMCRIGASDDQMRGISTFMAEMLEAAAIVRTAGPETLVIVDELGRGTSTSDGFGLAYAIAYHLAARLGCWGLFATHFFEMTTLADALPGLVRNAHMAVSCPSDIGAFRTNLSSAAITATAGAGFDTAGAEARDITLLYRVADGACDQSYGIHVAEMAGLPRQVVELARLKVKDLELSKLNSAKGNTKDKAISHDEDAHELEMANSIVSECLGELERVDIESETWEAEAEAIRARYLAPLMGNRYLCNLLHQFGDGAVQK